MSRRQPHVLTLKHYSNLLGRSDDYLAVYAYTYKLKKEPFEIYQIVKNRMAHADFLVEQIRDLIYEVENVATIGMLGAYLVKKGVYSKRESVYSFVKIIFMNKERLTGLKNIERFEMLKRHIEDFIHAENLQRTA